MATAATETSKNYIGGEWVDATGDETFDTTNPATAPSTTAAKACFLLMEGRKSTLSRRDFQGSDDATMSAHAGIWAFVMGTILILLWFILFSPLPA